MAQSPEDMAATMIANMPEKTGKPLEDWVAIVAKSGLQKHGEIVKLLKTDHAMTHGFANLVAHTFKNAGAAADQDPMAALYAGPKEGLRPIHDALAKAAAGFGSDVEFAPKKGYVSLRRNKQFALIQPSTKTRVDLGLNLKGVEPAGKLEAAGSWNGMVSHRVRLENLEDVDADVLSWLKAAYDAG